MGNCPRLTGTKAAAHYTMTIAPGESQVISLRLSDRPQLTNLFGDSFTTTLTTCKQDADAFYQEVSPFPIRAEEKSVQRQAFAGLLWTKQYFEFDAAI